MGVQGSDQLVLSTKNWSLECKEDKTGLLRGGQRDDKIVVLKKKSNPLVLIGLTPS